MVISTAYECFTVYDFQYNAGFHLFPNGDRIQVWVIKSLHRVSDRGLQHLAYPVPRCVPRFWEYVAYFLIGISIDEHDHPSMRNRWEPRIRPVLVIMRLTCWPIGTYAFFSPWYGCAIFAGVDPRHRSLNSNHWMKGIKPISKGLKCWNVIKRGGWRGWIINTAFNLL